MQVSWMLSPATDARWRTGRAHARRSGSPGRAQRSSSHGADTRGRKARPPKGSRPGERRRPCGRMKPRLRAPVGGMSSVPSSRRHDTLPSIETLYPRSYSRCGIPLVSSWRAFHSGSQGGSEVTVRSMEPVSPVRYRGWRQKCASGRPSMGRIQRKAANPWQEAPWPTGSTQGG
jgi:hypothetical protein